MTFSGGFEQKSLPPPDTRDLTTVKWLEMNIDTWLTARHRIRVVRVGARRGWGVGGGEQTTTPQSYISTHKKIHSVEI